MAITFQMPDPDKQEILVFRDGKEVGRLVPDQTFADSVFVSGKVAGVQMGEGGYRLNFDPRLL